MERLIFLNYYMFTFYFNSFPFFCDPIKNTDLIKPYFVSTTSPKQNYSIISLIIMQRSVRALSWSLTWSFNLSPLHWICIEAPDIIHIYWIYIKKYVPAYPPNKIISSFITQLLWPQRGDGFERLERAVFTGRQESFSVMRKIIIFAVLRICNKTICLQILVIINKLIHFVELEHQTAP